MGGHGRLSGQSLGAMERRAATRRRGLPTFRCTSVEAYARSRPTHSPSRSPSAEKARRLAACCAYEAGAHRHIPTAARGVAVDVASARGGDGSWAALIAVSSSGVRGEGVVPTG